MSKKKFTPKSDQVDFTHARLAPVINCVLKYKNKILIVKRSELLNFYPGYWNGVSGFLDDSKSIEEKVYEEVEEETGITKRHIDAIHVGEIFHVDDPKYGKTWIVHPVLVTVKTDNIQTDWEAEEHAWIDVGETKTYALLPSFEVVLEKVKKLIEK